MNRQALTPRIVPLVLMMDTSTTEGEAGIFRSGAGAAIAKSHMSALFELKGESIMCKDKTKRIQNRGSCVVEMLGSLIPLGMGALSWLWTAHRFFGAW